MRIARFFTEVRQVAWVLLAGTLLWGVFGYVRMPQRKDPEIPIAIAVVVCPWPGESAAKIEDLVTRPIEQRVAENVHVTRVESFTRTNVSVVYVELTEGIEDPGAQFEDLQSRLDSLRTLPPGAGPVQFLKDFSDTATLMLTVASPRVSEVEVALRARAVRRSIEHARSLPSTSGPRVTVVYGFPQSVSVASVRRVFVDLQRQVEADGVMRGTQLLDGPGFIALDGATAADDAVLARYGSRFVREHLQASELHPDAWRPAFVRAPADTEARLAAAAGDKYSYKELEAFTDLLQRTLHAQPLVSRVTRSGVLPEQVRLEYSQERLAQYGVRPLALRDVLQARNITVPGGTLEVGDAGAGAAAARTLRINPSGEFTSEREIGDVLVPTGSGRPVYLRDLVDVRRGYQLPARFLNFHAWRTPAGEWQRSRAITLAVMMRSGTQIAGFARQVDTALAGVRPQLPEDLVLARTSDQPLQVTESIDLFTRSLLEALVLVVLVSLIGFWDWRSAVLMALSIPLTLAMTFGMMHALGLDLQQVSIASLIIALGLLVDVPVVAGDAIKREMGAGEPRARAAWIGPGTLLPAMTYATITNVVAYLPFLALTGNVGNFLYSMPLVISASLVSALVVATTFVPLIGSVLLKPVPEPPIAERRGRGFAAAYSRLAVWAIDRRWLVLGASVMVLIGGLLIGRQLKPQFFPKDLSYLSYVDVWLPEDAPLSATAAAARDVEDVIREVAAGQQRPLVSLTTFLGGGAPRFWFSVSPEISQLNYAQVIVRLEHKEDTALLVAPLQAALDARVAGARVDVRQLETGKPVGVPVSVRVSGDDEATLREAARKLADVLRADPRARGIRNDWGSEGLAAWLEIAPDRANLAGITNLDVAISSVMGMTGFPVATLREGRLDIPVVAGMRMEERAQSSDVQNLYVYASQGSQRVPLRQISRIRYALEGGKIVRRQQFRTMTVSAFPVPGVLPSEVLQTARPAIDAIAAGLPPGFTLKVAGEHEKQQEGFGELAVVMAISVGLIFLALVVQFRSAVKPFIVFAAIPYGLAGAVVALWLAGEPFGFMGFLGVASLVGVVVSHIIVLFDFIEEQQAHGAPLRQALVDAGILRLRPVLITVVAFLMALVPLAMHGGPLWEPMCYAQIGGLAVATFVTLLIVPVLYSILVLDLKLIRWSTTA
jgi:multidrug efflux pump subunit AcrB